jgi:hypothetical protein
MVDLAEQGGGKQADARTHAIVVDVEHDIATARVESPEYLDHLHLAKTPDGWQIVHIVFRPRHWPLEGVASGTP